MIALSVNINKIALIRNSREGNNPDLIDYALRCIKYGAQGITVHPRPDQRHIRASDCLDLKQAINGKVELNIEGNPLAPPTPSNRNDISDYPGFLTLVAHSKPEQCTLVPDSDQQLTSDHGFNLKGDNGQLIEQIQELKHLGTRVSLFMDPEVDQITRAAEIGADRIELYTGPYAWANDFTKALTPYETAAQHAQNLGLGINAGHDLNLGNLPTFKNLSGLQEVSIGHALTIDSLEVGLQSALGAYLETLK